MMTGWKKIVILAALAGGSVYAAPIRGTAASQCGGEVKNEADKLIRVDSAEWSARSGMTFGKSEDSDEGELSRADEPEQNDPVGSEPSFPGMQ